jgi:hypothetical protein
LESFIIAALFSWNGCGGGLVRRHDFTRFDSCYNAFWSALTLCDEAT